MEATLQVIMEQLRELPAGQSALKSDVCAEVKYDISKIRVEPMTQVLAMDNKMGNCMSAIREELETQISDLCAGQAELEERLSGRSCSEN